VADDQFALAAADRNHRVDSLDTRLKRFFYRLAIDDAGSDTLDRIVNIGDDLAFAVDGVAERIDDASDHGVADRHAHNAACAFGFVAFFDRLKISEKNGADLVFFEVERESANVVRKFQKFAGHDLFEAVDLGNTVADLDNGPDFVNGHARVEFFDLSTDDLINFVSFKCFHISFGLALPVYYLFSKIFKLCAYGVVIDRRTDLRNDAAQ